MVSFCLDGIPVARRACRCHQLHRLLCPHDHHPSGTPRKGLLPPTLPGAHIKPHCPPQLTLSLPQVSACADYACCGGSKDGGRKDSARQRCYFGVIGVVRDLAVERATISHDSSIHGGVRPTFDGRV